MKKFYPFYSCIMDISVQPKMLIQFLVSKNESLMDNEKFLVI